MKNMLLAKPKLEEGWIDLSVGEAHVVREALLKTFSLSPYELPSRVNLFEYPCPTGYSKLVQLLEDKYKYPVIITNGAKQALSAVFYAIKKQGKQSVGVRNPYWALLKPLAEANGLKFITDKNKDFESYLCVAPENPTNFMPTMEAMKLDETKLKDLGIPFIHDGAYFTRTYLPPSFSLEVIGDVQIYSASKMFGLSGIRLGWVVCKNKEFYSLIKEYVEMMTVGVSTISQVFLYDLMNRMNGYPAKTQQFEFISNDALIESKKIVKGIRSDVLEVPADFEKSVGMFGLFKKGPKLDLKKSKINVVDGEHFGAPGYVRMNLALSKDIMQKVIVKLNQEF
jgi:aspartate/methionine/tyrosine aminotransferase